MDTWNLNGVTGNVITYDGRYDGAVNEDGSAADAGDQGTGGQGQGGSGEQGQGGSNP